MIRTALAFVLLLCAPCVASAQDDDIGYPDVSTALAAVIGTPGVVALDQAGWSMARVEEGEGRVTIWSFAKFSHPAYPTAVRRTIVDRDGMFDMQTRIRCEGPAPACDDVRREFAELEARVRARMAERGPPPH